jgi:predicted Zn-dependent protease
MLYMSEAGYDPQGAIQLQETFVELSKARNQDWINGLFASHPPSTERVKNNIKTAQGLPAGGEMGKEIYRQKMAYLKRVQPAYDAYDEARKAVAEDHMDVAQEKINRALSIEPRESLFHDLQGDIYAMKDQNKSALTSYKKAVKANPGFFYGHLREGQMRYLLDQPSPARASLTQSLDLMPTAEAHYLLGMIDKKQGNLSGALEHFKVAAGSESEMGLKATRELILLDLEQNPGTYVGSRVAVDSENQVWVQFGNLTKVPLTQIVISYAWLDQQGQTRQATKTWRGTLGSGQQNQLMLGFKVNDPSELSRRVRAEVTGAKVAP